MRFCTVRNIFITVVLILSCIVPAFAEQSYAHYIGSGYIDGVAPSLGKCEIYVPIDTKGSWGVTDTGFLCNVTSSSISGVLYDQNGREYSFNCSGFSTPRYRAVNSSSYTYTDLYLNVGENNVQVAREFPSSVTWRDCDTLLIFGFMGVILFFLMRYKR